MHQCCFRSQFIVYVGIVQVSHYFQQMIIGFQWVIRVVLNLVFYHVQSREKPVNILIILWSRRIDIGADKFNIQFILETFLLKDYAVYSFETFSVKEDLQFTGWVLFILKAYCAFA